MRLKSKYQPGCMLMVTYRSFSKENSIPLAIEMSCTIFCGLSVGSCSQHLDNADVLTKFIFKASVEDSFVLNPLHSLNISRKVLFSFAESSD